MAHGTTVRTLFRRLGVGAVAVLFLYGLTNPVPVLSATVVPITVASKGALPPTYTAPAGARYQLFGNGMSGDCVIAALANASLADAAWAGVPLTINTRAVMRFYHAVEYPGGGTLPGRAFSYWSYHGFAGGRVARFAGLVPSRENIEWAIFDTGAVIATIALPHRIIALRPDQPWTVGRGAPTRSSVVGLHEVALIGFTRHGFVAVTWGHTVLISWRMWAAFGRDAWEFLPPVVVKAGGYPGEPLHEIEVVMGGPAH